MASTGSTVAQWASAAAFALRHLLPLHREARRHGRDLRPVRDRTSEMARDAIVLFCTLRNEAFRIPYFLEYYRTLGVGHFVFVDNGSDDGFQELVRDLPDVSVWTTTASYKASAFGMHWLNHLLARHGVGRWCVVVDPDEFLVFPRMSDRSLRDLVAHLDADGLRTLPCILIDMYGAAGPDGAVCPVGESPLAACPWFDAYGYRFQDSPFYGGYFIQGGVRERLFFTTAPELAPALNKIPLVRWRRLYAYQSSTHTLLPRRLNEWHPPLAPRLTGALLHFKFLASFRDKVSEEMVRREHFADSAEYRRYASQAASLGAPATWMCARSRTYASWHDLVDVGLMTVGRWF